jgi:6-phosphogluconolactonase
MLEAMRCFALASLVLLSCSEDAGALPNGGSAAVPASSPGVDAGRDATLPISPTDGSAPDASPSVPRTEIAFVGGADGQIRTYAVDSSTGALTPLKVFAAGGDPSFLAFDEARRLVFAIDSAQNRVRSFAIDPKAGTLTEKSSVATGGTGPTHVSLVPSGKFLLIAHYTSGHVSVVPVAQDGTLSATTDVVLAGDKAHYAQMDAAQRTVYVPCLGANAVARYTLDGATGKLTALSAVPLPAGAGPRHLSFSPTAPFAFVVNELQSSVTSFAYDSGTGGLTLVETKSSLPPSYTSPNTGAEIFAHPDGKYVYASNRGQDTITRFVYDAAGKLTLDGQVPTFGRIPRSFTLAGGGKLAYVANQGSGTVYGYTFEVGTGSLKPIGTTALVSSLGSPEFVGTARFVDR